MKHIAKHLPALFLLECVKNLAVQPKDGGPSNLTSLISTANELGYLCTPVTLDALQYGMPSKRDRYYVIGVRVADSDADDFEPFHQADEDFEAPAWQQEMIDVIIGLAGIEGQGSEHILVVARLLTTPSRKTGRAWGLGPRGLGPRA